MLNELVADYIKWTEEQVFKKPLVHIIDCDPGFIGLVCQQEEEKIQWLTRPRTSFYPV